MNRKQKRALGKTAVNTPELIAKAARIAGEGDLAGAARMLVPSARPSNAHPELLHLLAVIRLQQGMAGTALPLLERAVKKAPEAADIWFTLGTAHEAEADWPAAIAAYRKALALDPDLADAGFNIANSLAKQGQTEAAVEAYRALLEAQPAHLGGRYNLARCLADLGETDEARTHYRQILDRAPNYLQAHIGLANLHKAEGRFGEARAAYQATLRVRPDFGPAFHSLGDMKTYQADDPDIARMQRLLSSDGLDPGSAVYLHFALAKAYEDIGDHDSAWASMTAGSVLRRRMTPFDIDAEIDQLQRILEVTARPFEAAGSACPARPIFLVGLPRTGSSLVEQIFAGHSEIRALDEIPDFDLTARDAFGAARGNVDLAGRVAEADHDLIRAIGSAYAARIEPRLAGRPRWTDKRLPNADWVGIIRRCLPQARIIQCRRHPLDTVVACYRTLFRDGHVYSYDLTELSRMIAFKTRMMDRWRELWPDHVTDIAYEDLVGDLEGEARRLFAFCDLAWDPACLAFHQVDRMVKTASGVQVRQPLYTGAVGRWRRYAGHLAPARAILEPLLSDADRQALGAAPAA